MAKTPKVKDPNKLSLSRLLAWKSSDIGAAAVSFICLNYLTIYCADTLGLNSAAQARHPRESLSFLGSLAK